MRSRTSRRTPPRRARASGATAGLHRRARAGARGPPRSPAPGRTCKRAARTAGCARAATRADNQPRRTRGKSRGPVAATRASGTSCAGASRADDDEPAALVQHLAVAQLGRKLLAGEDALEHRPARAVIEHPCLVALDRRGRPGHGGDDDELGRDAPRLGEEALAVVLLEVAVEVTREHAVERAVPERELERVAVDELRGRHLLAGDRKLPLALVEPDDVAAQMACQEAGAAGDVERAGGRQGPDQLRQDVDLLVPPGPVAVGIKTPAEPPVVVLVRAAVVVRLQGSYSSNHAAATRIGPELLGGA